MRVLRAPFPNVCTLIRLGPVLWALGLLGCTLDTNGTGELSADVPDASADTGLLPDGAGYPDTSWPDAVTSPDTATDQAPGDAPTDTAPEAEAGEDADAAQEADVPDAGTDTDAPEDAPEEEDDVSVADAPDCDASACDGDGGDASTADAAQDGAKNVCDKDGDGVLDPQCGGDDCCDTDPLVHPGQTSYFSKASACGSFDYDCNGSEEKRWTSVGSGCHNCWLFLCCADDGDYVSGPPACGQSAEVAGCSKWPKCDNNGGLRQQECR